MSYLIRTWTDIRRRADRVKAPAIAHRDLDLVQRILRDQLSSDFTAIRVDSESEYERIVDFVNRFAPKLVNRVKLYTKDTPILEHYGVQAEIDKAVKPRVWLKSGGYIVINQTEALVAIDVNTGKFVGKSNRLEDTIVKTNLEAAKEIVRQIRLRDLGGIIVLDFIDMEERKNRAKVMGASNRNCAATARRRRFSSSTTSAWWPSRANESSSRSNARSAPPAPIAAEAAWSKARRRSATKSWPRRAAFRKTSTTTTRSSSASTRRWPRRCAAPNATFSRRSRLTWAAWSRSRATRLCIRNSSTSRWLNETEGRSRIEDCVIRWPQKLRSSILITSSISVLSVAFLHLPVHRSCATAFHL